MTTTSDWRPAAGRYAATLAEAGAITDPAWRQVFAAVPRHVFVPQYWHWIRTTRRPPPEARMAKAG